MYITSITDKRKWPEDARQGETSSEIYKEKKDYIKVSYYTFYNPGFNNE